MTLSRNEPKVRIIPDPDLSDELLVQLGLRIVHGMGDQVDSVL